MPAKRVHFEAFGPSSLAKKPAPSQKFKIKLSKSGKTLEWTGEQGSILELAEANNIKLQCGCRMGTCGTCRQKLISGSVDYSSPPAADIKDGEMLTCISRPTADLELNA